MDGGWIDRWTCRHSYISVESNHLSLIDEQEVITVHTDEENHLTEQVQVHVDT